MGAWQIWLFMLEAGQTTRWFLTWNGRPLRKEGLAGAWTAQGLTMWSDFSGGPGVWQSSQPEWAGSVLSHLGSFVLCQMWVIFRDPSAQISCDFVHEATGVLGEVWKLSGATQLQPRIGSSTGGDWDLSKKGKPPRAGSSHHSPHPFPARLEVSHFSSFKVLRVNYDVYYLHLHSW